MTGTGKRPAFYLGVAGFATGFASLMLYHAWSGVLPPLFTSRNLTDTWTPVSLFFGIILGSLYFRSRSERLRSNPRIFVFMQIALGIASVLAMQLLLSLAGFPGLFQSGVGSSAAATGIPGALLVFGVLFVPAFLLSGLLEYGLGSRAFMIFLLIGCALGALGQAFLIAPAGGLWVVCLAGSGIVIASGLAGLLAPGAQSEPETGRSIDSEPVERNSEVGGSNGGKSGICGLTTVGYSGYFLLTVLLAILSSRLIFISAGHTVQASSITAATFFAGLAMGVLVSAGPLRGRFGSAAWLGVAAGLVGVFGLAIGRQAPSLPLTFLGLAGDAAPVRSGLLTAYWALAMIWLLVPGVLLGTTLVAARRTAGRVIASGEAHSRGGRGWGLTAAAAGALLAVLLSAFLPSRAWSFETLLTLVPWICIAIGLMMLALSGAPRNLRVAVAVCILAASAVLTVTLPSWNKGLMTAGVYVRPARFAETVGLRALLSGTEVIAYEESPGGAVSVERTPDAITLKANGTFRAGTAGGGVSERLSAHIPLLLHDRPRSVLVVGAGTGAIIAAAAAYPLESIECVEGTHISGRTLRPFSSHNRDAVADKRLAMSYADPWNYLSASNQQYDVVLLESPAPFTSRGAALLTADFFELLRSKLRPGGMACQAISTADLSPELLGLVTRTFTAFFPHVTAWWTGGFEIILIGGMEPHLFDPDAVGMRMALSPVAEDLALINISEPLGILALYIAGREEILPLGSGSTPNTLLKNRLAHHWPGQTIRPRRGSALAALDQVSTNPLVAIETGNGDPSSFESARESLERCTDTRGLYLRSADEVAAGSIMYGISVLGEALDGCRLNGMLAFPLSEYYMLLSRRNMAAGRPEEALENARRAVELNPLGPATFYNLANIELGSDPATATALLERATELDPSYVPGYLLKAKAELSEGKPRDAAKTVGRVLTVEPFNPTAHHLKGLSLIQREQYEAGRLELERALEGMPDNLDIKEALAYSWLMQGRFNRAADLYRQVLRVEPERFGALNNYATVLAEQGKLDDAVAAWTRALALSPGNRDILANIEEARQNMRR